MIDTGSILTPEKVRTLCMIVGEVPADMAKEV